MLGGYAAPAINTGYGAAASSMSGGFGRRHRAVMAGAAAGGYDWLSHHNVTSIAGFAALRLVRRLVRCSRSNRLQAQQHVAMNPYGSTAGLPIALLGAVRCVCILSL